MTAYVNRRIRRGNNADNGRPPRVDVAQQFEDAGFRLISHNQFKLQSYGQIFIISPSWDGLKVAGETMHEPQVFDFGTSPEIIADWIVSYAQAKYLAEDWLTANLPETKDDLLQDSAPACYGLGKGEY